MYLLTFQITAFSMRKISNFKPLKQHDATIHFLLNSSHSDMGSDLLLLSRMGVLHTKKMMLSRQEVAVMVIGMLHFYFKMLNNSMMFQHLIIVPAQ